MKRFDEVVEEANAQLTAKPDDARLLSALANAYARLGRTEEAHAAGNECLRLKDAAASGAPRDLAGVDVPLLDASHPDRNVIAFSLCGNAVAYGDGAVRNAIAAKQLYPEWRCRFYIDESVPPHDSEFRLGDCRLFPTELGPGEPRVGEAVATPPVNRQG